MCSSGPVVQTTWQWVTDFARHRAEMFTSATYSAFRTRWRRKREFTSEKWLPPFVAAATDVAGPPGGAGGTSTAGLPLPCGL